jgi:hypothetical protein
LVREDWHRQLPTKNDPSIKDQVMYNAVMHKFNDDPTLKKLLLSTAAGGARRIVEQTHKDDYWGTGPGVDREWARNKNVAYTGPWQPGMSGNNLGLLLVRIRDEISSHRLHGGGRGYAVPAPSAAGAAPAGGGYQHQHQQQQQQQQGTMCLVCQIKPANPGHPDCGRSCAQQAGPQQRQPAAGGYNAAAGYGGGQPAAGAYGGGHQAPAAASGYAPQPGQQQQLQVQCPHDAGPGATISIRLPDGRTVQVVVPQNVGPQQMFTIGI